MQSWLQIKMNTLNYGPIPTGVYYWRTIGTHLTYSIIKMGGGLQICKKHNLHIYPFKWEVSNLAQLKLSTLVKEKSEEKENIRKTTQ